MTEQSQPRQSSSICCRCVPVSRVLPLMRPSSTRSMLAGVMNQPPAEHADGPASAGLPTAGPGAGRRVHEHAIADWRARGVRDAHRIEYLTLDRADEKAVRGCGARGWPRVGNALHEGQHVPEDGEVDVVIVRHALVTCWMPCLICSLAALSVSKTRPLSRRNPAWWVSSSRKVMVSTPGPLTQFRGRKGEIGLSMLRWCRASDFRTAIVVNILPTLATFTMTSGPMASRGGSAAVRAAPEEQLATGL